MTLNIHQLIDVAYICMMRAKVSLADRYFSGALRGRTPAFELTPKPRQRVLPGHCLREGPESLNVCFRPKAVVVQPIGLLTQSVIGLPPVAEDKIRQAMAVHRVYLRRCDARLT
jgi:hypothetical protein